MFIRARTSGLTIVSQRRKRGLRCLYVLEENNYGVVTKITERDCEIPSTSNYFYFPLHHCYIALLPLKLYKVGDNLH